jgi:hypothetical protein
LVDAFKGVQVVISTVGIVALGQQKDLARAAKEAGVKLFAPSEYGGQSHLITHFVYLAKKEIQDYLKEIKLPYTLFYTGVFPDTFFTPCARVPPLPVWVSFSNLISLVPSAGILPVGRSLLVLPKILSASLLVRTSRGSSPMGSRSFLPLGWNGALCA